jgi:hypothetical protein
VSDQGFMGETEALLRVSPRWENAVSSREQRAAEGFVVGKDFTCDVKTLCVL